MDKKIIKIVALIAASLLFLGILFPIFSMFTFAAPKDSKLLEYEQKETDALRDLYSIEIELNAASDKVYQAEQMIAETDKKIAELDEELAVIKAEEEKQLNKFKGRFVAICENGSSSYLELIFSATSFSDFIDKLVIAQELAEYDKNIIDSMQEVKNKIQNAKNEQEALRNQQEQTKIALDIALKELQEKSDNATKYLEKLQSDKKAYEAYLDAKAAEEARAKQRAGITRGNGNVNLAKIRNGMFMWPTTTTRITSNFSPNRVNPVTGVLRAHTGTDIGAFSGEPIYASSGGTVTLAESNGGYGNCVIINHGNNVSTLYAHMSAILVSAGQTVVQGQQIGRVGSTGNSTGPHLHFEVIIDGTAVDPMQFF